jgi:hypothetical protein
MVVPGVTAVNGIPFHILHGTVGGQTDITVYNILFARNYRPLADPSISD